MESSDTPERKYSKLILRLCICLLALVCIAALASRPLSSLGGRLSDERLSRARTSPQFSQGKFHNSEPVRETSPAEALSQLTHGLFGTEERVPLGIIPVEVRHTSDYESKQTLDLRLTWMGHASVLIEIDGRRVLIDPVWSDRASPVTWLGPKRFHRPPIWLADLPKIDLAVISHDHYDHLDMATIQFLAARGTRIAVPVGVGAHLESWGIAASQFTELDWNEGTEIEGLKLFATPARHYSGRNPLHARETLWASWVIQGPNHRVYYSGDTGYSNDFKTIGKRYGPFDFTVMKIGGSDPSWADIHMTPEQAVQAHLDLGGRVMLPVHWGTFNVAFHSWNDPIERAVLTAANANVSLATPRPGQFVDISQPLPVDCWWRMVK